MDLTIEKKIAEKFQALLIEGKTVLDNSGWDGEDYHRHPNGLDYRRFRTEALNLTRRVCGEQSDHYLELKRIAEHEQSGFSSYYFKDCFGILEAAHRDFEQGFLFDLRSLLIAELLGDFIDQADHLLVNGYWVAAASLAGAVLEDTLRKLCDKHGIPVPSKTNIDSLNSNLARKSTYDKGVQKRITALADIRNSVDHGHFKKVKKEDVEDMLKYVRRFAADYLK